MRSINIHQAKTQLSRLVEEAAAGDPFIIAKAGRPIAKVVPLDTQEKPFQSRIGFMDGEGKVPDDFDTMFQDEIIKMFEGEE